MCAHIFGGTSSACCSNYALRRTAVNYESIFGKASETLQKNFYVVDLLNSLKDVESAKQLVKMSLRCGKLVDSTSQSSFKQQGVTLINPRELGKNWCQKSRPIRSTSNREGIGNLLRNFG